MTNSVEPRLIVGIGASAGGLSPIEEFFDHMPNDNGMAFVIVQHLSPDFKSLMDELLSRHTKMQIYKVVDGMRVEANSIYLIPPEKNMALSNGQLLLTDVDVQRGRNLPIDNFLQSLATEARESGVAVVLSGTGSDGSRGVKHVREAGGIVLAQSIETAGFDGMPKAAIQSKAVDVVCAPSEMPTKILDYSGNRDRSALTKRDTQQEAVEDSVLFSILRLFRLQHGVDFTLYKQATINRRVERRMQMGSYKDIADYASYLESNEEEVELLFRDLLVEVTQFFRDQSAFERLRADVIPKIVDRSQPGEEIRIWVPGCATGEEAYSLAMLFHEAIRKVDRQQEFKVFATDVHRNSLETASTAVYPTGALENVPMEFQHRYFTRSNGLCHIKREIRQKVIFAANDLTNDPPFTRIDLISCRNVLIYLENRIQKRILSLFHFGLKTGGVLFLGPSETVGDLASEFDTLDRHWRVYSKRRDVRLPDATRMPMSPALSMVVREKQPAFVAQGLQGNRQAWITEAMEDLLSRYVPPSLLVNEFGELVHTFGDARKLLVQPEGRPTLDALKMITGELRAAVSAALHRAKHGENPVVFKGVKVSMNDSSILYRVTVEPYSNATQKMFLVCLEEMNETPASEINEEAFVAGEYSTERISQLERELNYTRETLQATVEELESSNEELQATNEELIASNEELQSTNEELHSVNEELYTVNSEHKQKIEELTQLTTDMDNLLKSTDIGTIFLDDKFRIRMFTPAISAAFNVMAQDVGRPISHIAYKLDSPSLLSDVDSVLQTGEPKELEVQGEDGRIYLQRIQPYQTEDEEDSGIVLTTTDITAVRRVEYAERQMMTLAQVNEELPDFAYAVSHDLQAPLRHISQYSQILSSGKISSDESKLQKASNVINESVSSLRTMMDGLLAYSRVNTRGRALTRVNMNETLAEVKQLLQANIEYHNASIEVGQLPVVFGDAEQLQVLLFHLMDNAIKYSSDDLAVVNLQSEADGEFVRISVTDNGIGIESRHADRIFTMFKRLGFKADVPGAGVGLALCKRVVVRHGGRIWLNTDYKDGAQFCFTLQKYQDNSRLAAFDLGKQQ